MGTQPHLDSQLFFLNSQSTVLVRVHVCGQEIEDIRLRQPYIQFSVDIGWSSLYLSTVTSHYWLAIIGKLLEMAGGRVLF